MHSTISSFITCAELLLWSLNVTCHNSCVAVYVLTCNYGVVILALRTAFIDIFPMRCLKHFLKNCKYVAWFILIAALTMTLTEFVGSFEDWLYT